AGRAEGRAGDGSHIYAVGGWNGEAGELAAARRMTPLDRRSLLLGVGATLAAGRAQAAATASAPSKATQLLAAARTQVGVTLRYDPSYTRLAFPGGDVPREKGVCTDVIVRAYRDALKLDLQAMVNADMRAAFDAYPRNWGLAGPDR